MAKRISYPLDSVIMVKKKRVEEQEKVVRQKEQALEKEKEKLAEFEKERDKAKEHLASKLAQLRYELDHGTTSDKVQQMKAYLNVAKDKLKAEDKKVKDQEEHVETAKKALEAAIQELKIKRQEVDKLENHKIDWLKEMRKEEEIIQAREEDELGSISYATHKRRSR